MSESGVTINLKPRQFLIGFIVLVSLVFAGDYFRSMWAGTPGDVTRAVNAQTEAFNTRLDSVASMARRNQDDIKELNIRVASVGDSLEVVVLQVGKNLEGWLRPLFESRRDTSN